MNDKESGAAGPSHPPTGRGRGRGRALFPSWMNIDLSTLPTPRLPTPRLPTPPPSTPRPPTPPPEPKPKRRSHKKAKRVQFSVPETQPRPQRPPPPTDQLGYEAFQEETAFPRGEEYDPPEPRDEPPSSFRPEGRNEIFLDGCCLTDAPVKVSEGVYQPVDPSFPQLMELPPLPNTGDSDEFQIIPHEEAKKMKKNKAQQQQKNKTDSAFRYGHIPEIKQAIIFDVAKLRQKKFEDTGIFIPPSKPLDLWTVPAMRNQLAKDKILGIEYDERTKMPKPRIIKAMGYGKEDIVNWYNKAEQELMRTPRRRRRKGWKKRDEESGKKKKSRHAKPSKSVYWTELHEGCKN
jgi:hypothetical protein